MKIYTQYNKFSIQKTFVTLKVSVCLISNGSPSFTIGGRN